MYALLNRYHNSMDGAFCYGMLEFVEYEWGTDGMICVYRCSQCGATFRNVE